MLPLYNPINLIKDRAAFRDVSPRVEQVGYKAKLEENGIKFCKFIGLEIRVFDYGMSCYRECRSSFFIFGFGGWLCHQGLRITIEAKRNINDKEVERKPWE